MVGNELERGKKEKQRQGRGRERETEREKVIHEGDDDGTHCSKVQNSIA